MYSITNFIKTTIPTDTAIVFQDSTGKAVRGMNICKYLDVGNERNVLWVTLEGAGKLNLDFVSEQEAKMAVTALRSVIDNLYPNCALAVPVPAPPTSIVATTVAGYLAMIGAASLVPLQWYDVTDTMNQLGRGAGQVFRVVALTTTDHYPQGIVLLSEEKVILNFDSLGISDALELSQRKVEINDSEITLDATSDFIYASNQSTIISVNSRFIRADNSQLDVENCNNIVAENCAKINFKDSRNIAVRGISGSFTSYVLRDIEVNQTTTLGKFGEEPLNLVDNEVIKAYQRYVYQDVPILWDNLTKILDTVFIEANAEFRFRIPETLTGHTLTIKNKNLVSLMQITDAYVGCQVEFIFNKTTGLFVKKLRPVEGKDRIEIPVTFDGQTLFPSVLSWSPIGNNDSLLFVNGVEQRYGITRDFRFVNRDLIWMNNHHILETTDLVELFYS